MIEITVAGAGAGKTHGLALSIAQCARENSCKFIFALTYTNAAREKIEKEITSQLGNIPSNIIVDTVHAYLLNEIIYPFSPFCIDEKLHKSTTVGLGDNPKWKAVEIKRLKDLGVLHVDATYPVARKILDMQHTANKSKSSRQRIDRVLSILAASTQKIFLDEAQDLDENALRVFEILGRDAFDVFMIGDPKQAIKHTNSFQEFVERQKISPSEKVLIQPTNNVSRRVPKKILSLSNRYCYPGQEQEAVSDIDGELRFIESTHPDYKKFIEFNIRSGSLIFIDQKQGVYSTRTSTSDSFHPDIEDVVKKYCDSKRYDPEIYLEASKIRFHRMVAKNGIQAAIDQFYKEHKIEKQKKLSRQLSDSAKTDNQALFVISSIDSVKGLESETCIFILTPNTFNYLCLKELDNKRRFNKEWKKMYVALTRARREIILAFDLALFDEAKLSHSIIRDRIIELGFTAIRSFSLQTKKESMLWQFEAEFIQNGMFQGVAINHNNKGFTTRIYGAISENPEEAIRKTQITIAKIETSRAWES